LTKERLFSLTAKDFRVDTFRAGGPGGQNQNKRDTGVRIIHLASGAIGEARDRRSQVQNKRTVFQRLVGSRTFQNWLKIEAAKAVGPRKGRALSRRRWKSTRVGIICWRSFFCVRNDKDLPGIRRILAKAEVKAGWLPNVPGDGF